MTVYKIYDEAKKNGILVGLDAWIPKNPDPAIKTWRDYVPELEDPTVSFQKVRKEREQKEEETLQKAAEYFG